MAMAVDGKLATLAPRSSEHFVKAELKAFEYGELDDAIAWAGGVRALARSELEGPACAAKPPQGGKGGGRWRGRPMFRRPDEACWCPWR